MRARLHLCAAVALVMCVRMLHSNVMLHITDSMFALLAIANIVSLSTALSMNQSGNHASAIARINSLLAYHLFATLAYVIVAIFHKVPSVCGRCCDRPDQSITQDGHQSYNTHIQSQSAGKRVLYALSIATHSVMLVPRCLALLAICTLMANLRWRSDSSVNQPVNPKQDMQLTFFFASSILLFVHGCVLMVLDCRAMKRETDMWAVHANTLNNQTPHMMINQPINQSEIALAAAASTDRALLMGEMFTFCPETPDSISVDMTGSERSVIRSISHSAELSRDFTKSPSHVHRSVHEQCVICLVAYQPGECLRKLPCFHIYHDPCIQQWLRHSVLCPTCRYDLH